MNLKAFVTAKRIVLNLSSETPRDILAQLTAPLAEEGVVSDAETFINDLERREAEVTTVMENGVAIPHARSHAVRRLGMTVGITPIDAGVMLNPEADVVCCLFFCIAVPSFAPTAHIPLLQALAKFSRDPKRVDKILRSKTAAVAARYLGSFRG